MSTATKRSALVISTGDPDDDDDDDANTRITTATARGSASEIGDEVTSNGGGAVGANGTPVDVSSIYDQAINPKV